MENDLNFSDTTVERLPPQSIEAEQAILGAILVNPETIGRVCDVLQPDQFYRKAHQIIYAAVLDLFEKSEPIDIVTVSQYLKDQGKLDGVGGRQYLTDLGLSIATTANAEYYAKTVAEKATLRNLIKAGTEIVASCYEDSEADVVVDKAEQLIFNIAQGRSMSALVPIKDIVNESFARIEKRYEQRDALSGLSTGFYDLDEMTSGWQRSDLVIIAARPSMGKTALVLNLAQHAAVECKAPVAVFSLEMSKEQLVQRLLCAEAKIDANKMRTGFLQSSDWQNLAAAMGRLGEAPLYIDDSAAVTVLDVRAKARRLKAEMKGLGLIIIDYIQLMQGRARSDGNRVQEVSEISRGLKQLARELDCPVLALSQLSRAVEARQNKRPMLSDLRESGCLTGDSLIFLPDTGEYARIDSLVGKSGFKVLALNPNTWKLEPRLVTNSFSTGRKQTHVITTRSNRRIRATANHKFLTIDGWRRLDQLSNSTQLATPCILPSSNKPTMADADMTEIGERAERDGRTIGSTQLLSLTQNDVYWDEIVSIEPAEVEEVFDLTVDGLHNFIANDIIVHNSIEQDADIVMFIYRDDYYNQESEKRGEAEIIIAKQRNGPVGTVELLYQASITRFLNKASNNTYAQV